MNLSRPLKTPKNMNEARCLWNGQVARLCYINEASAWIKVYKGPEVADAVENTVVPLGDLWLPKRILETLHTSLKA